MPQLQPAAVAPPPLLDAGRSQLLVVDVQSGLLAAMSEATAGRALASLTLLLNAADALGVPTTFTEHMPAQLGATVTAIARAAPSATVLEKVHFCAAADPALPHHLAMQDRPQLVIAGMETHVCVLQTSLVLAATGYAVHLAFDASAARSRDDEALARARAAAFGVVPVSADMVAFEWLRRGDHPARRRVIDAVKTKAAGAAQAP